MVKDDTALAIWTQLNARQQSYLKLIHQIDQEKEREEKQRAFRGQRRPAEVWRWLFYGDVALVASPLKQSIRNKNLVDPGTGSTYEALERRKLIECRGEVPELDVKLTPLGRKVARTGLGEPSPRRTRTPKGMLSELAWEALVLAYCAGEEGLKQEWGFRFSGIHVFTWDRLQDYLEGALVQEIYHPEDSGRGNPGSSRIHITRLGIRFYHLHWEQYSSAYPDIDAPRPVGEVPDVSITVDIAAMVRTKRGSRGMRETADEIGGNVSPSTLSRLEAGKEIDPSLLNAICRWLGVPAPQKED
jgi:DNA-binding Xre family transcriptional regulator